ncbi:cysteine hydrolase [Synechococcus sp. Tobar12-5m-g]|jgi:nicotinamidase-related amidase|uniref:isochorismatase family cysteine hydrolase n=1 Tax=unclassified Synechococcus TaxID=2626047 RepID=UPI0020CE65E3|nr:MULTISPECIES: isochorismatase family cysteine hydrolase [unclassified Synechococcus]MCP9772846.1 cysteine hydrolase [Synechococcus sp. Tobar12-5m-g]MCP9873688.1 cysteine hydrolase [Synechococcus sp. Cruz CV-v-12]
MRTALVLIDLINDITHPAGAMPTCAAEVERRGVLEAANRALALARRQGWPTMLVKVGFSAGYPELPVHAPIFARARELGALRLGQWGTEFHAELAVEPSDLVLVKHRLSPFHGTALAVMLRAAGIERLLLGGVSTAWALQAAAREGHDRDHRIVLVEDACAAATRDEHERSIEQLSRLATVVRSADLADPGDLPDPC